MPSEDLFENLIDKIAEAVVRKIEERQKIDLIAQAVIARLEEQRGKGKGQPQEDGEANPSEVKQRTRASRDKKSQKTASQRSNKRERKKRG